MEENNMCKNVKLDNLVATAHSSSTNSSTITITSSTMTSESLTTEETSPAPGTETPQNNLNADVADTAEAAAGTVASMPMPNGKGVHFKLSAAEPAEELLGSVTMHNCPGTRASARVIQKMKQDQTRPMTPPPNERDHNKKDEKTTQKTPSQIRATNKTTWTNVERNIFFDALNEFGKDFEAVANCINTKLKRRNTNSDYSFKSKDQVRQNYYQTYHKICKYVRFSDELKKPAQELYTLINYGEMRRKLQFLSEKHFMKLKQLVYQGQITVRCKGKNIRIKTPSCKALRRLNQLDDSLEDIRLPSKIEVLIGPANMEAFCRVQTLAQNPRGRIIVPLHKKLITFIKTFQYKWRSSTAKLTEEKLFNSIDGEPSSAANFNDAELCFLPKPGVAIHRPLLSITAYMSNVNICLNAYEERLGIKVRSETLLFERNNSVAKRTRTESGSEKRSPDTKKVKLHNSPAHEKSLEDVACIKDEQGCDLGEVGNALSAAKPESSSGDELCDDVNEFISIISLDTVDTAIGLTGSNSLSASQLAQSRVKRSEAGSTASNNSHKTTTHKGSLAARNAQNFRPLLSEEAIKHIRKGWTVSNAADITIGDLYVALGQDCKLELEYYWSDALTASSTAMAAMSISTTTTAASSSITTSGLPYNVLDCDNMERVKNISNSMVSNKLKHLLMVANLSERVRRRQCSCGHSCERIIGKCKRELVNKAQWMHQLAANGNATIASATDAGGSSSSNTMDTVFRAPLPPIRRPIVSIDPVRQLSALTRQKMSRQVLVQRRILPNASTTQPYDLLDVRNLQSGLFEPIERANSSTTSSMPMPVSLNSMSSKTTSTTNCTTTMGGSNNDDDEDAHNDDVILNMPSLEMHVGATALPSTCSTALPEGAQDETTCTSIDLFGSVSPMHLLRDTTSNSRWLDENINDFSLSSLLDHLDEIDASRDILDPSSNLSVISETSVDFRHKFQEITALLQNQEKD